MSDAGLKAAAAKLLDGAPPRTPVVPKEVSFYSGGLILKGYLYLPPGRGPFACIINNHGSRLRQGVQTVSCPQTAAITMAWGYAFFYPHRRGYGESPGESLVSAVPASIGTVEHDEQITLRLDRECDDVIAAIDFAAIRPEIDVGRIALSGSSRGGILSLLAAVQDERVRCCINFCGGARQWATHPKLRAKMLTAAREIQVPVFLAQAENDFNTAATTDLAEELDRAGKVHECHIYPPWGHNQHEGHQFEGHGAFVWGPDVRAFLLRHLR